MAKIPAITLKVGQKVNFTSEISAYDQKVATNTGDHMNESQKYYVE